MICKVCSSMVEMKFAVKIMHKYDAEYFNCNKCGFLFAGNPVWLDESYKSAINISDTGIMDRNLHLSRIVSILIYFMFDKNKKFVDYAGGYGIFTRLMRDIGFDFYWQDIYCDNLLARGFELKPGLQIEIELLTAFEVFEHLVNPMDEIKKMIDISGNIIFSTLLLPEPIPEPDKWWYYGFEHGQHVSFYSFKTLSYIAEKSGLHFYSYRDVHLFSRKKLNNNIFKALILFSKLGLSFYVKKKLRSKIWEDHTLLENNE